MGSYYIGECRLVGFNFAPVNWLKCDGGVLGIAQYDTLFSLIGTTYGGDGQATFGLPDLQGRVPVSRGGSYVIGQTAGVEAVTLTPSQLPVHSHPPQASFAAPSVNVPQGNLTAGGGTQSIYVKVGSVDTAMNPGMIGPAGSNQPHDNLQPYLVMNWMIAFTGIFPSQT